MIKIAVCDDEEVMCEQLKQMIASRLKQQEETFQITCYTNAIQFLHTPLDFDLIFLDIQMPNLDGVELAKRLRQKEFEGVLIFVTVLKDCMLDAFEVEGLSVQAGGRAASGAGSCAQPETSAAERRTVSVHPDQRLVQKCEAQRYLLLRGDQPKALCAHQE